MPNTAYISSTKTTDQGCQNSSKVMVSSEGLARKSVLKGVTFAALSGVLLLTGCATKPTYQSSGPTILVDSRGVPNYYQVKSGDTVSQIAARYGLNYRQLGALNHLDSKYTIYAGQWLQLWQGRNGSPAYANNNNRPTTTPQRGNQRPTQAQTQPNRPPVTATSPANNTPTYNTTVSATKGYGYPSGNQVIKNFNAAANEMSMWFSGNLGDPVLASKEGQVLYAGDGLPEYGNLIMIRHDATYITVYAHNNELLVKEGDQVRTGQRIATMGSTGQTNQVALQFQVRENGTPIDPRAVLGL
ncbi:peptidoglycan DD-metalloendopeptidase family protein [Psychrobacter sp. FDAARGOS_221]|uniref:peptidoglycan DD-metalloendopeptidase family protein n=1 Tax=Psychrobacter sp. FDAARGOS_221 TaxID=1975705 RepID=UPI000BB55E5A|nr:peptidoglycan DD-metalloendopeptidase family protein [Psychrobacter sp. FDAARGOS_221]PNK61409.1 LysM peptidoglycan-binding domain-containing protein [Psychrobacter sp. FDAARGOS_221]